jgi:hypothetical protein
MEPSHRQVLCPSAPPDQADASLIGVVVGGVDAPRLSYLRQPLPVLPEILALAQPADPREVYRAAAPCAETACQHFREGECTLAARVTEMLPAVVDTLPACSIRRDCRWFRQEGRAACERCPQIVTLLYQASAAQRAAAIPRGDRSA